MSGGVSDGYEGTKRQRMTDSNPYLAVSRGGTTSDAYDAPRPNPYSSTFYPSFNNYGIAVSTGVSSIFTFPVVRLRGLPFNCEDLDVYKFFADLDVVDCLLVNKNGRFSGEAFVVLSTPTQAELALRKNRQNMGRRYVEVFQCKKQEYYQAIANEVGGGGSFEGSPPPPPRLKKSTVDEEKARMEYTEVLKLRGLPYSATANQIVDFFGEECKVGVEKVHVARRPDGKMTGEAYVEFASVDEAKKAMCKDKMTIGSRYVELFPSTLADMKRAASRFRN